ncbi:hypothetical protein [Bartonella sp. SD1336NMGDW]|uniref:hypothetical protein n=1 Tax=Bartonella sp. SD1336NMGDW TaxID=3243575 RepID=UPI0035CF635A
MYLSTTASPAPASPPPIAPLTKLLTTPPGPAKRPPTAPAIPPITSPMMPPSPAAWA